MTTRYVYDFTEAPAGVPGAVGLLGEKGAELAELTRMGLPVPPGFTVTTEACRVFRATGEPPPGLDREIGEHLAALERTAGKRLGRVDDPLLLSVRASAEHPAPGLMETVLDLGLNDYAVLGLGKAPDRERFAWDSYRRLVQMFGTTVMGVDPARFERVLNGIERQHQVPDDSRLDTSDLIRTVESFKDVIAETTGEEFPQEPAEQLRRAVLAAFACIPDRDPEPGPDPDPDGRGTAATATAVTVQTMVFGNLGPDSGSGLAVLGRDPRAEGEGRYLPNAQGRDVVSGARPALPLRELAQLDPEAYARLTACLHRLAAHHRGPCEVQFTIEHGTLWLLGAHPTG
ncbi:PEP/pyruvate-binding domain-containing protein [Streptomyces sp. NPDC045431]|uniref:PEP/pyruvate-binding domain-containing protein n=1 Tax=Streptomyces sp. NPDC045431 TaxID=3155613 RepID=UPI00340B67B5